MKLSINTLAIVTVLAVTAILMLFPDVAFAQDAKNSGIKGLTANWKEQGKALADFAVYGGYFVAVILVLLAAYMLKQHSEDERQGYLKKAGWSFISAAILATGVTALGMVVGTFYGSDASTTKISIAIPASGQERSA